MAKRVGESFDRETRLQGPYRISDILGDVGKAFVEALECNVEVGDSVASDGALLGENIK